MSAAPPITRSQPAVAEEVESGSDALEHRQHEPGDDRQPDHPADGKHRSVSAPASACEGLAPPPDHAAPPGCRPVTAQRAAHAGTVERYGVPTPS